MVMYITFLHTKGCHILVILSSKNAPEMGRARIIVLFPLYPMIMHWLLRDHELSPVLDTETEYTQDKEGPCPSRNDILT